MAREIGKIMATNDNGKRGTPAVSVDTMENGLVLKFSNGDSLTVNAMELSEKIRHQAMLHGLKQKLVDAAAISRNPETGASATVNDKYDAIATVLGNLRAGEWNSRRAAGEGTKGGLLFRALCRMYTDKTPEQIREFLATLDDKKQATLRTSAKVAAVIEEIKAEDAAGKPGSVDVDALLAGLGG